MNHRKVLQWSVVVALGGFLFGLDTAVISGCVQTIQQLWSLCDAMTGQMVAMALCKTFPKVLKLTDKTGAFQNFARPGRPQGSPLRNPRKPGQFVGATLAVALVLRNFEMRPTKPAVPQYKSDL